MLINKFVISKLSGQFVLGFIDKEDILMEGLQWRTKILENIKKLFKNF